MRNLITSQLRTLFFGLLISGFWLPASAFAACTNPAGLAGEILYNSDYSVFQWCDGAQWIGFPVPVSGTVLDSFASPGTSPDGLTWDGASLWHADSNTDTIYKLDPSDGTVLDSFASPGSSPIGLTWDGTNLWNADGSTDTIYKIDPANGAVLDSFASPSLDPIGLAWDGTNLWNSNNTCCSNWTIYKLDPSDGTVLDSFAGQATGLGGLTWDGASLWHADWSTDTIYKLDPSDGTVLDSFASPGGIPMGLAWDGTNLWNVDGSTDTIYKIEVIPPGPSCADSPAGTPGAILYNSDNSILQWCDGAQWIGLPTAPSGWANPLLDQTFDNPDPTTFDLFGSGIDIFGTTAAIGTPENDPGGSDEGTVYLFDTTDGSLLYTLDYPGGWSSTDFGSTVGIDGNVVIIGAHRDGGFGGEGRAFVFDASDGSYSYSINPPDPGSPGNSTFGYSVDIDGNNIVIGDRSYSSASFSSDGIAYIFDATDGTLLFRLNNPSPASSDKFGNSVSISGTLAVVGAYLDDPGGIANAGTAYVFDVTDGSLVTTLSNPAPNDGDNFGWSVAINGTVAVVGAHLDDPGGLTSAGTAYIFNASTGSLIATLNKPDPRVSDNFGTSVATNGTIVAVGAPGDESGGIGNAGAVHMFDASDGSYLGKIDNPNPADADNFGNSVALSGTTALVGDPGHDVGATSSVGIAYTIISSTACINPAAPAGAILYNSAHAVMQWCDGTKWTGFPKPPIPKTVFITSTTYDGNLGNLSGAHDKCNTRAAAAGLSGTYKAWIGGNSPSDGPSHSFRRNGPLGEDHKYTLTNGTVIATNWADLTDGTLAAAINIDEFGNSQTGDVWSNAAADGKTVGADVFVEGEGTSGDKCWSGGPWGTGSGGSNRGQVGDSSATNANWADYANPQCNNLLRLYCFEQ